MDKPGKGGYWTLDHEYIQRQDFMKRNATQNELCAEKKRQVEASEVCWNPEVVDEQEGTIQCLLEQMMATESPSLQSEITCSFESPRRKRRAAELEATKLLEMLMPNEDWEESAKSVVQELYSASLQHQAAINEVEESDSDDGTADADRYEKKKSSKSARKRVRRPKLYSSMASTIKMPTPLFPKPSPSPNSAARSLQYHQYQPATPTPSGVSSAK